MQGGKPMLIWQIIQVIGSTIWLILKTLFSLLPVFDEINSLPDQMMAAALGIPVVVISVGGTLFAIGKFVWKHIIDA